MEQINISDKRKKLIILLITLILFIGASFAFVAAQLSVGIIGNANVTADTTDNLQFSVDKDINLNPTQFNVPEGGGGLSDTAIGSASLIANSTNNEASATYNVYFKINTNEYIYTTEDNKPEIVLTIIDPTGTSVTEVSGLTYVTAENADGTTVRGFDITTEMGLFTIASDYGITSASSIDATEQDWIFTVTFINLTTNQTENSGSTLDAEIILGTEKRYTLANYIIENVYVEDGVNGLYYHDGVGAYTNANQEAGDNSYRYSGANYTIADEYQNEYTDIDNLLINLNNTTAYVYKNEAYNGADSNGMNKMNQAIYKDFAIDYCNVNACDYEELLNQILNNTIEDENITNALGEFQNDLMITGEWATIYSGILIEYNGEVLFGEYNIYKYLTNEFCSIKIGLMYVSDYGYAATPEAWSLSVVYFDEINDYTSPMNIDNNWIFMGAYDWTISRYIGRYPDLALYASYIGYVGGNGVDIENSVRPVFYLKSNVELVGGTGTVSDPFLIN